MKLDRAATFIRGRHDTEGLAEWATLTVGEAATRRHIVVGADIFFKKEEIRNNTINTLPACISAAHNILESLKPWYTPTRTAVYMILSCLPFVFIICYLVLKR